MCKFIVLTATNNNDVLIDASRILKCVGRDSGTEIFYKSYNQVSTIYCKETPSEILTIINRYEN